MDRIARQKTNDRLHPEHKVKWNGYSEKYDMWVAKECMSNDCIREFNSIPIDDASSILATVPIDLYPSSPRFAMAQLMSTMVAQKDMLKDGIKMQRNNAKNLKSSNTDNAATKLMSDSPTNKVAGPKEATLPISNNDDDNN